VSDLAVDASLALQWFLEDETGLEYSLVETGSQTSQEVLGLTVLAQERGLATYNAAYLKLAARLRLPLAITDRVLRVVAEGVGVSAV